MDQRKKTTGLIIGKFLPPHNGHKYLVDFARNYVDDVYVQVCSIAAEPIRWEIRFQWMKEIFWGHSWVHILHNDDENPQYPHEHPEFWNIWKESIEKRIGNVKIDYVFASEEYGFMLAEVLGAQYIAVDHMRELVPISWTEIRENPYKNWGFIPEEVRPYFTKKICIFWPESTGKSTLTKKLAAYFQTVYVHEYARPLLDLQSGKCEYSDIEKIARGHHSAIKSMLYRSNGILFVDTDILTTKLWSEELFGRYPEIIDEIIQEQTYDLYLLCDVDTPWVDDIQRYLPNESARKRFFTLCESTLKEYNRSYVVISGNWEERLNSAIRHSERIIDSNK